MKFDFQSRRSDSPLVDSIWRTQSEGGGSFTSVAESHWGLVVTRQVGKVWITVRGPETKAAPAPIPEDAEFFGIIFKLGTYMPHFPARILVDSETNLPEAKNKSFWLHSSAWQFPDFDNADTFVERLVRQGLLVHDPVVDAVLRGNEQALSRRSVQYRFAKVTGVSYKIIQQIERARRAMVLLEQGASILDTVYQLGYFDQAHITNSLKRFIGKTPAQIARINITD
jgi:AraC-like DNA-binding protein